MHCTTRKEIINFGAVLVYTRDRKRERERDTNPYHTNAWHIIRCPMSVWPTQRYKYELRSNALLRIGIRTFVIPVTQDNVEYLYFSNYVQISINVVSIVGIILCWESRVQRVGIRSTKPIHACRICIRSGVGQVYRINTDITIILLLIRVLFSIRLHHTLLDARSNGSPYQNDSNRWTK